MIYPKTFEDKIGFNEIRTLLRERCLSSLGKEEVDKITFMDNVKAINTQLSRVREFRRLQEEEENFPLNYFFDVRQSVARLRLEGTHMEEDELFDLRRSLGTVNDIVTYLNRTDEDAAVAATDDGWRKDPVYPYPALHELAKGVVTFPQILQRIDQILDKFGKIRDTASPELLNIRRELAKVEGSISRTLYSILRSAQSEGLIEKDVTPAMRDGRLVIPVVPTMKRKIKGIVHDESASGKTLFIEPTEVVEANNRVRELEAEERREVIRILTEMAKVIRPHVPQILDSYKLLAQVDMLRAKTELAKLIDGIEPEVGKYTHIDWIGATHPLLRLSLQKQGKKVVPLEITLTRNKRMLIISGPNAGGKSVCLKTVGLVQYMLQCGLSVPMSERSQTGIFQNILIDIGDEQSIEDDLSTYSSHLTNMKNMMKSANDRTLILIDEFGTGTEPQIGGAIAEAVLKQFCIKRAYGVITTHYQNLKHFADSHEGVVNGAMLYDRHQMQALFQLQIGQPGSSFAIEIARKIGLPEQVIHDASEIVGSDYIQSDKYLQDIVRDKRYWESKRQTIHQREKQMEQTIAKYESEISDLAKSRKEVLAKAKERAEELFKESNKKIENVIREIREKQAEKEETKKLRDSLKDFKEGISDMDKQAEDDKIARKMAQILRRKENKKNRKKDDPSSSGQDKDNTSATTTLSTVSAPLKEGDTVRIKGTTSVGKIESVQGKNATVIFGDLRSTTSLKKLEHATAPKREEPRPFMTVGRQTRETIDEKKLNFKQDLDVRGMRGDEALNAVMYFIDDATLVGMSRVRILHGTGTGILRQLIRQYLATVPAVTSYKDEHVQFGGAGITVVDLG
ncbi:Smr/MutS family protein [uncultured Prevotella sp.]|uniref:endonuclease MutS2 n=1 Tax=uncultured Prevotella sp. TaxID=159272 RepID=UPI00259741D5|nr:Smr/MutS family protein [uncultured Prevotella sp.]